VFLASRLHKLNKVRLYFVEIQIYLSIGSPSLATVPGVLSKML
jgi:hypothetical protein